MKSEHEQGSGKSWIGPFIASAIDQVLQSKRPGGKEPRGGHCVNLTDMIIAPLVIEKVPDEILEHLKIEFMPPKTDGEATEDIDEKLYQIREVLTIEFGQEVVGRLKLSLSEDKIRNLPHKQIN